MTSCVGVMPVVRDRQVVCPGCDKPWVLVPGWGFHPDTPALMRYLRGEDPVPTRRAS